MKMNVAMKPGSQCDNKIAVIKVWRHLSGLGLKEAKDAVEEVMAGKVVGLETSLAHDSYEVKDAIRTMQGQGMEVSGGMPVKTIIIRSVDTAAKLALENGEHDLSIDLIQILKKYSNRGHV